MTLDNILKGLAVILLAPFFLVATWVALILITTLFTLSIQIVFWIGGALAVVCFIGYLIRWGALWYEDKTRETRHSRTD